MSKTLKVLGPYAILKVQDVAGTPVMMGYYKDAVVPNVDDENAQHHIDSGLAEEYGGSVDEPTVEPTPPTDGTSGPGGDNSTAVPKGNASREEWAAYAANVGAPEEETRPVEEGGLKQTELREKYGN